MDEDIPGEPLFRANKRRKVFRKRTTEEEAPASQNEVSESADLVAIQGESEDGENESSGLVRFHRMGGVKKRGIAFTSSDALRGGDDEAVERALVVVNEDGAQEAVHGDRFVKPTGKVAVAENKHMVAYIDSKMAEMRSATSMPHNGPATEGYTDMSFGGISQSQAQRGHAFAKPPAQAHSGPVTYDQSQARSTRVYERPTKRRKPPQRDQSQARSTRVYERPTKRRKPPQRDQTDIARDSIIDQIMQESQVPLYDRSSSHTPANDVDNDTATAEAFKAQLLAEMEEQNRRRPPPHNPAAKGEKVSHGPKLGGSRAQREKMRALEEAKNSAGKK